MKRTNIKEEILLAKNPKQGSLTSFIYNLQRHLVLIITNNKLDLKLHMQIRVFLRLRRHHLPPLLEAVQSPTFTFPFWI